MDRSSQIACVVVAGLSMLEGVALAQGSQRAASEKPRPQLPGYEAAHPIAVVASAPSPSDAAPAPAAASASPPAAVTPAPPSRVETVAPTSAGGATWTSGLGLVELSARSSESRVGDKPSASVLSAPISSVPGFGFRVLGGADKLAGQDDFSAIVGGAFRFQSRHVRSLFSPWVDAGVSTTRPTETSALTLYDVAVRGGIDWHPARISHLGLGPFIGYRQIHARTGDNDAVPDSARSAMIQGLDVGGQIQVRTREARTETSIEPPAFDATLYAFMQGAGLGQASNRAFVGLLASAGGAFRGVANIEGCASESATCFPRQLRLTGGFGGMW